MQQKIEQQSRSIFFSAIVAGVVGTAAFNAVMYIDIAATGVPLDLTRVLGSLVVGRDGPVDAAGYIFHFANGIGLALFYVFVFLPISKRVTKRSMWFYAIIYAVIVAVGPIFFGLFPALGAGIAGMDISPLVAPMTIVRHIVFGATLGILVRGSNDHRAPHRVWGDVRNSSKGVLMTKKSSRKYSRLLLVAIMAPSMAFFMTLFETLVRTGFLAPNFLEIWMSSFATGLAVIFPLALILSRIAGKAVDKMTIKEEIQ